jgi:uncharacterized protein YbgA (DUF1722 family)/uncharacterized protein YbbK (DUF523 family)
MTGEPVRPRLGVSSCLLGAPVRFNGGHSEDRFLTRELGRHADWVAVCPEIEIGLGAPRETLRLVTGDGQTRLLSRSGSSDHTAAMRALAPQRLAELAGIDGYVFKSRSPSCGLRGIPRYRDGQVMDRTGRGVFAATFSDAAPLLPVEEEGRLNDARLREHFVEQIFAHARLRQSFAGQWRPADLITFHTRHKLQLLAHDPAGYREAGRLVAEAGTRAQAPLRDDYTRVFCQAIAVRATRGRHVNALQHAFGMISAGLDDTRRRDISAVIEALRRGEVPLSVPIALLRHHAAGAMIAYLEEQTYFEPFPADLRLRHHVG